MGADQQIVARLVAPNFLVTLDLYRVDDNGDAIQTIDVLEWSSNESAHVTKPYVIASASSDWTLATDFLPGPNAVEMSGFSIEVVVAGRRRTFTSGLRSRDVTDVEASGVRYVVDERNSPGPFLLVEVEQGVDETNVSAVHR